MSSQFRPHTEPRITVSIVSHGQGDLLKPLLVQLKVASSALPMHVIITLNVQEAAPAIEPCDGFELTWIINNAPQGFAENHNAAFRYCRTPHYCVLNPDVRINNGSLAPLIDCVVRRPGVAGPRVVSPCGSIEDNARQVPSPARLFSRWWHKKFQVDYSPAYGEQQVDWLAGMCLVFDSDTYRMVGGFDERYRLYCEDVDICLKIHLCGRFVTWVQEAEIIHDAQRASHRWWRYRAWHVGSLARLLSSSTYWRFRLSCRRIKTQ